MTYTRFTGIAEFDDSPGQAIHARARRPGQRTPPPGRPCAIDGLPRHQPQPAAQPGQPGPEPAAAPRLYLGQQSRQPSRGGLHRSSPANALRAGPPAPRTSLSITPSSAVQSPERSRPRCHGLRRRAPADPASAARATARPSPAQPVPVPAAGGRQAVLSSQQASTRPLRRPAGSGSDTACPTRRPVCLAATR